MNLTKSNQAVSQVNADGVVVYSSIVELQKILQSHPKKEWVRQNKYSDNALYVPVGIVEQLLNVIYPMWDVQMVGEPKVIANSVVVSVQLRVFNPFYGEWLSYAGVGAVPIELRQDSDPTDFTKINSKALHRNVPSALAFAQVNAAKRLGRIFGADLNRKHTASGNSLSSHIFGNIKLDCADQVEGSVPKSTTQAKTKFELNPDTEKAIAKHVNLGTSEAKVIELIKGKYDVDGDAEVKIKAYINQFLSEQTATN